MLAGRKSSEPIERDRPISDVHGIELDVEWVLLTCVDDTERRLGWVEPAVTWCSAKYCSEIVQSPELFTPRPCGRVAPRLH
jgi:hypothetical protein